MTANEPVAWAREDGVIAFFEKPKIDKQGFKWFPLYTHPVKELDEQFKKGFEAGKEEGWKAHKFHHPVKELTDDEILDTFDPHFDADIEDKELIKFARAILRKALEKWT